MEWSFLLFGACDIWRLESGLDGLTFLCGNWNLKSALTAEGVEKLSPNVMSTRNICAPRIDQIGIVLDLEPWILNLMILNSYWCCLGVDFMWQLIKVTCTISIENQLLLLLEHKVGAKVSRFDCQMKPQTSKAYFIIMHVSHATGTHHLTLRSTGRSPQREPFVSFTWASQWSYKNGSPPHEPS